MLNIFLLPTSTFYFLLCYSQKSLRKGYSILILSYEALFIIMSSKIEKSLLTLIIRIDLKSLSSSIIKLINTSLLL